MDANVRSFAEIHDKEEKISRNLISKIARYGYLGALVPKKYSGLEMDLLAFGILNQELGKVCTAVRSLITVQSMVSAILHRWGTQAQKDQWLKALATGDRIGGFALTEPEYGSDAGGVQTQFTHHKNGVTIKGQKKWISFGQIADVFLVFGQNEGKLCCAIVDRETKGLDITAIKGILGSRGSMLARLDFHDCHVPKTNLVGNIGFGLHPIGFTGLDMGRYSIAWGCVGMAQACLDASIDYAETRHQFGKTINKFQLIQAMIADMVVDIKAARLLCEQAGRLKQVNDRSAMHEMMVAKYYAANMAERVTSKAVEIHGANGYSSEYIVERFYRDAKIMQTIEGSNQMMQMMIGNYGMQAY